MKQKKEALKKDDNIVDEKVKKEDLKKKQNKQIIAAIVIMVSAVLIVLLVQYVIANHINKFSYGKLDYTKSKLGKITFYSTKIPLIDKDGKIAASYSMDFRNDPRKLEYINVSIPDKSIELINSRKTYVSIASDVKPCEYNGVAMINMASFLREFTRLDVKGATSDPKYANETNMTYASCESYPNNTVILIQSGNETKIEKTAANCYELTYKDCEVTQVTEKFDLIILQSYMGYFKRK